MDETWIAGREFWDGFHREKFWKSLNGMAKTFSRAQSFEEEYKQLLTVLMARMTRTKRDVTVLLVSCSSTHTGMNNMSGSLLVWGPFGTKRWECSRSPFAVYVPTACLTYSSAKNNLPIFETHWLGLSMLIVTLAGGHGSGRPLRITLHFWYFTLDTPHFSLYILYFMLCTWHSALYTLHSTL